MLCFAVIWLLAETVALVMCLGLWIASGFGGRLRSARFQRRHYAVMRWFLDVLYRAAEGIFGLRVSVTEPVLDHVEAAARLTRGVFAHRGQAVGLLDDERLFANLRERVR